MRRDPNTNFSPKKTLDIQRPATDFQTPNPKRKLSPQRRFMWFVIFAVFAGVLFTQQVFFSQTTLPGFKELTRLPVIREIRDLTGANDNQLKGESRDRINVLVMGQGGPGHPGPYLTDTMMLASFKPSTGQIAVLSIPRDLVVPIPNHGLERVNAANAYGEASDYPGGGANFAAKVLEDTLRIPINYYARVDFSAFEQLIDDLGGVEIDIERTFTDYQYPDNNYGYEVLHFDAGKQTLDGERALKYVRSRHAEGEAGDFARVKRQQNLILAVKDKILTPSYLLNPAKLTNLYKNLSQNLATNVQLWELPLFLDTARDADFSSVTFKVLDDSPAGPLYATTLESGAYVLAPKIADYSEIQFVIQNLFTISDIKKEGAKIVIQNGTAQEGLALNTAAILTSFEFNIVEVGNAPVQNFEKTVLFDLSGDSKIKSRTFLEETLQTKSVSSLPTTGDDFGDADFLIILGNDQISSSQTSRNNSINPSL